MDSRKIIIDGSRVTIAYILVFVANIAFQVTAKTKVLHSIKKLPKDNDSKLKFNRYAPSEDILLAADRVVGNYIEWTPIFLSLFWMSIYFSGDSAIFPGYAYVVLRLLYLFIGASGGITRYGPRKSILLATVPMYAILLYFLSLIIVHII